MPIADDRRPLTNAWYFLAGSEEIKRGRTLSRQVLGQPILAGRDASGKAFALTDICPHRGMPLHFGSFDGTEIACRYHGWRFNTEGICTKIPALAAGQSADLSKVRTRSHPVQEIQGNIWVFIGDDPALAASVPEMAGLTGVVPKMRESMLVAAGIDDAVIGLMDPAHGPFVHRSWFWRSGRAMRDKEKHYAPSPWGFTMLRHRPASSSRAYRILGGTPETEIAFQLPSVRWEHITVGRHIVCQLTMLTPVDDNQTLLTQATYWTQSWLFLLKPLIRYLTRVFLGQDRDAIIQQQIGLAFDPKLLLMGDADAPARWYFRLKNEYRAAQAEARPFANPVKPRSLRWRT